MVERSECLSHGAVHECCRGLAVSRGGNDAVRDVPRPTLGSSKSTHHVREVRPCVVKMCVVDGDHLSGQLALNPALIAALKNPCEIVPQPPGIEGAPIGPGHGFQAVVQPAGGLEHTLEFLAARLPRRAADADVVVPAAVVEARVGLIGA